MASSQKSATVTVPTTAAAKDKKKLKSKKKRPSEGTSREATLKRPSEGTSKEATLKRPSEGTSKEATLKRPSEGTSREATLKRPSEGTSKEATLKRPSEGTSKEATLKLRSEGTSREATLKLPSEGTSREASLKRPSEGTSKEATLKLPSEGTSREATLKRVKEATSGDNEKKNTDDSSSEEQESPTAFKIAASGKTIISKAAGSETDSESETERPPNLNSQPFGLALPAMVSGKKRPGEGTSKETNSKRVKNITLEDDVNEKKTVKDSKIALTCEDGLVSPISAKDFDLLERSFLFSSIASFSVDEHLVKEKCSLLQISSIKELVEMLRMLRTNEYGFLMEKRMYLRDMALMISGSSK